MKPYEVVLPHFVNEGFSPLLNKLNFTNSFEYDALSADAMLVCKYLKAKELNQLDIILYVYTYNNYFLVNIYFLASFAIVI